jgi:hypothetical protein
MMRIIQTSVDVPILANQDEFTYYRIINFAICDLCHWCASCLKLDRSMSICPNCGDDRLANKCC